MLEEGHVVATFTLTFQSLLIRNRVDYNILLFKINIKGINITGKVPDMDQKLSKKKTTGSKDR